MAIQKSKKIKASEVFERFEVDPKVLGSHPQITHILTKSLGKIEVVIGYLRGSDSKEALELVRLWDLASVPQRKVLTFEGFCLAAKSTPRKMMGVIMQAVLEESSASTEMLAAAAQPQIIERTIKEAKKVKGQDERKILLQHSGFMPAPKNTVFNNFGSMSQDNRKQIANVSVTQLDEDSDNIASAMDKFNTKRMLESGEEKEVIDVTAEG